MLLKVTTMFKNQCSPVFAVCLLALTCISPAASAQRFWNDRKVYLNEEGSHYLKFTMLTQIWLRQQQYNPGTTIFSNPKESGTDIGIRRFRLQAFGQLTDRVFIYTQLGENNFNNISERKFGFFVHDAIGEYNIVPRYLSLGAGLTGWSGFARFASPAAGGILGLDAPLFQQSTNDVSDQFLRKLSVYAKGKIGKADYRVTMAQPMALQRSNNYDGTIGTSSRFSPLPPKMQWNGYVQYQFWDEESNLLPYMSGTYLGTKKVLNAGLGMVYQPKAMWHAGGTADTIQTDMLLLNADLYYDAPLRDDGSAISAYASLSYQDFGPDYIRNLAVMNPANGNSLPQILNGGGNGFPAYGTGTVVYGQAGYKFRDNLIGSSTLLPYASVQYAMYERLETPVAFFDLGVNWLLSGHAAKVTLSYQNRPVFHTSGDQVERKGAATLQLQVFLN